MFTPRILKIGTFFQRLPKKRVPPAIPVIHLQGKYLELAGFIPGAQVEIIPESFGRITIEVVREFPKPLEPPKD